MADENKQRCWYMRAYPEKRCEKLARWYSPKFVPQMKWCDEHKFDDDVLVQPE